MLLLDVLRKFCPESLRPLARKLFFNCKYMYFKLTGSVLAGKSGYYCPCCDLKSISFTDFNVSGRIERCNPLRYKTYRQDVICPFCHSLPRHRILAIWCESNINCLRDKRILYFAVEDGMAQWLKRNRISIITADLFRKADLQLDLTNIEQPDSSWDVVFCNHILEHVQDYKKALSELYRILKPGGILICCFPIDNSFETVSEDASLINPVTQEIIRERIRKFGQHDHLRVFGRDSVELLNNAGFKVTVIDGDTMPKRILPVIGPADYDSNKLFVCEKREC